MGMLGDVKYQLQTTYYIAKNNIYAKYCKKPKVATIEETLDVIIQEQVSVSRYGDGEMKWMKRLPQNSFQKDSEKMRQRLCEIIVSNQPNHIVCIPGIFNDLSVYKEDSSKWYAAFLGQFRKAWMSLIDINKQYYDANISRFYYDYKDKTKCSYIISLWKQVWNNRDIIIVEGEMTRLGYGNDLFDNVRSKQRILAPAENAFSMYDSILCKTKEIADKDKLIIIALGPTATVLAYDLACEGYQAIDVGHIDVEYEWYLMSATEKVPIKYRYVNEATSSGGRNVENVDDENYVNEVICKIRTGS